MTHRTGTLRHTSLELTEIQDPEHSDFLKIRKMLIATHMQDLKEVTHDILYEQFSVLRMHFPPSPLTFGNKPKLPVPIPNALKLQSTSLDSGRATPDVALRQKEEDEIRKMQEMLAKMQEQH
ncbi:unnamed protein product [Notodromas monacha]|uniref:Septin-type G domain-containing protein n=1 Tax=Notodromas monacha TaxID=399045 RepID=A0A7R9BUP4_9CRUS|nr:unnamed protein product [Notodromas monacha]CAG0922074.1 unnamed protein product [Notodromas monacha]